MSNQITIATACDKYRIPAPKLWGHCFRDMFDDPIIVNATPDGEPLILDDWRLNKLAKAAVKAGETR